MTLKRYTPLRNKTPMRRTRLRPMSERRIEANLAYSVAVAKYRLLRPVCEFNMGDGKPCPYCGNRPLGYLLDNHHRKGKLGKLLCDLRWFMTTCRLAHRFIEDHREWSYQRGYLIKRY